MWTLTNSGNRKQYLTKTHGKHEGLNTQGLMTRQGTPVNNEPMTTQNRLDYMTDMRQEHETKPNRDTCIYSVILI